MGMRHLAMRPGTSYHTAGPCYMHAGYEKGSRKGRIEKGERSKSTNELLNDPNRVWEVQAMPPMSVRSVRGILSHPGLALWVVFVEENTSTEGGSGWDRILREFLSQGWRLPRAIVKGTSPGIDSSYYNIILYYITLYYIILYYII